jgi:hypothetical protein
MTLAADREAATEIAFGMTAVTSFSSLREFELGGVKFKLETSERV